MAKIVHVIGTGTIGEPLIGLLADHKSALGLDDVTFHKRTPLEDESAKVSDLLSRGARLAADDGRGSLFEAMGTPVSFSAREAIRRATVVIDCTPSGNDNKSLYAACSGPRLFLAQGSEKGFGVPYAMGINDAVLPSAGRFVQVVSCNTHNIAVLVNTLGFKGKSRDSMLRRATFVCMRRANDVSQDKSFVASPVVSGHPEPRFGTHHARDAHDLFATLGNDLSLWSSSVKLNTQYMHVLWFRMERTFGTSMASVMEALGDNPRVALTRKMSANKIFSFGRDHGYYGRILSQTVIAMNTLVVDGHFVTGFCYTPQDGNSLLSSVGAAMWAVHGCPPWEGVTPLRRYLFNFI